MGLIDYMSQNPAGSTKAPSAYDEEIVVASIISFINNLEMIFSVILSNLANLNKAPHRLIKERAENKRTLTSSSTYQPKLKHSAYSGRGHSQSLKSNQFCSKPFEIQSTK